MFDRSYVTFPGATRALPLTSDAHLQRNCIAGTWKVKNAGQASDAVGEEDAPAAGASTGTVQKKVVPWIGLTPADALDADVVDDVMSTRKRRAGEMIVVASLIDKLPNLGGSYMYDRALYENFSQFYHRCCYVKACVGPVKCSE